MQDNWNVLDLCPGNGMVWLCFAMCTILAYFDASAVRVSVLFWTCILQHPNETHFICMFANLSKKAPKTQFTEFTYTYLLSKFCDKSVDRFPFLLSSCIKTGSLVNKVFFIGLQYSLKFFLISTNSVLSSSSVLVHQWRSVLIRAVIRSFPAFYPIYPLRSQQRK